MGKEQITLHRILLTQETQCYGKNQMTPSILRQTNNSRQLAPRLPAFRRHLEAQDQTVWKIQFEAWNLSRILQAAFGRKLGNAKIKLRS